MRMSPWEHRLSWPGVGGGFVGRTRSGVEREADRLERALTELGAPAVVRAEQVHGGEVAVITDAELSDAGGLTVPAVDGLATDSPRAALAIHVADCLAVYVHDAAHPAVGLAHAGWRGLAAGIPGALVGAMAAQFDAAPAELRAALSPCIRRCCFEVGEDVAGVFSDVPGAVDRSRARPHVDLLRVAVTHLRNAGLRPGRIEVMAGCTHCEPERFASYRADPDGCGTNVALLALREAAVDR